MNAAIPVTASAYRLLFVGVLIALGGMRGVAGAAEPPDHSPADTDHWVCRYCAFPEPGISGYFEGGVLGASDPPRGISDDRGIERSGPFAIANFSLTTRDDQERQWRLSGTDLGMATRSLSLEGRAPGHYRLQLDYQALQRSRGSVQTPFSGSANDWQLPAGWTRAGRTKDMTALPTGLRRFDLEQQRERFAFRAGWIADPHWHFDLDLHHELRSGTRAMAATFLTQSSVLPVDIDDRTEQIEASASYDSDTWRSTLSYYGSFYRNDAATLSWDNPYTAIAAGADRGQIALAPDNQFHQLALTSGWFAWPRLPVSARLAIGRMTQDAAFLQTTVNPLLASSLPRNSLNGQVDTLDGQLRLPWALGRRLRLTTEYRYRERRNLTPRELYPQVATDVAVAAARTNRPYGFSEQTLRVRADSRLRPRLRLSAGLDGKGQTRNLQEVSRVDELGGWLRLQTRLGPATPMTLRIERGLRDAGSPRDVPSVQPPDNPRMVPFYLKDRDRRRAELRLAQSGRAWSAGLSASLTDDRYPSSELGVRSRRNLRLAVDAALRSTDKLSVHGTFARQLLWQAQAGSENFAATDWTARSRDSGDTLEIGFERRDLPGNVSLTARYVYAASSGRIGVEAASGDTRFPGLYTRLDALEASARTQLSPAIWSSLGYRYERFSARDWQVDDIGPTTLDTVLALDGPGSDYELHLLRLLVGVSFQ